MRGKWRGGSPGVAAHDRGWKRVHIDCGSKKPTIFPFLPNRTSQMSDPKSDKDVQKASDLRSDVYQKDTSDLKSDIECLSLRSDVHECLRRPISEKQKKTGKKTQ